MYTYEKDQELQGRFWIVDPYGYYVISLSSEDDCKILLSHLNR